MTAPTAAVHATAGLPELAPLAALLVLLELAAGAICVTVFLDIRGRAGRGYAGTTALICAAVMAVQLLVAANLPDPARLLGSPVSGGDVASLIHWSVALTALLVAFALFCAVGTDIARQVLGCATAVVAIVAVGRAAVAFGAPLGGSITAGAAFFPAALLAGSAMAGMLLGHWYLIAPDLSFRPLRLSVYTVFFATGVQALAIAIAVAVSRAADRDQLLSSSNAFTFWLLAVGSGIVFTAGVAGLTLYFARIRANQPATAMLYVLIITVLMGIVPAHLLFFRTSVPV